jgi:hypothetical protein
MAISCSAAMRACSASRRAAELRRLRATQVAQVVHVVGDVLDLEGVEHESLAGQRRLRLVGDALREGRAVADDLLHRQRSDDRAQRAREGLLRERLDLLLLAEEALGGGADRVLVAPDLDDRDALDVQLDALAGHGVADGDHDAARGEVEHVQPLDERHDEDAAAHDHLLAAEVRGDEAGLRVAHLLALAAGDDERLVGLCHLVAARDEQPHEDE